MLREFLRGAAQVHVLHHAAQGEVHGAWLAVELRRHGYDISTGTLYPMLHRMEETGLLVSRQNLVEGRNRRVYAATDLGRAELDHLRAALTELAGEVLVDSRRPIRGCPGPTRSEAGATTP
jgi:DNA-binding PadR family transcriptional regulator